jgi:ribose-phosphate pyrophosphokinase
VKKVFDYNEVFDMMFYPAGEPHIRLNADFLDENRGLRSVLLSRQLTVIAGASDWNDLMTIKIGDRILKDNGITATFVVPYMPFSRHDRKNDAYDSSPMPFVLDLMASVDLVTIDPHSDVSGIFPYYPQSEVVKQFENFGIFAGNAMVAIPDAGASKKTYSWLNGRDVVQCLKKRDPKTGALSGFQIVNPEAVKSRKVVIIDDICDGGGTFLGLAEELLLAGAISIRLGVTHGLFTKGTSELNQKFSQIVTLDTTTSQDPNIYRASTEKLILEGEYF